MKTVGNRLNEGKVRNVSLHECEKLCDENEKCNSLAHCTKKQKCYLFDKKLKGSEPRRDPNGCFTSYKKCKNGNIQSLMYINIFCIITKLPSK